MANRKMLAPNTTIIWVPEAGLTVQGVPTTAEINAGANISCAIVTGYTLNATDSDTDDSKSICDSANVQTPTYDNYECTLPLFRGDLVVPTLVFTTAFNLFKKPGARGYMFRRLGKGNAAVAAVGDIWSWYFLESDLPKNMESDSGGPYQMEVPFLPQGYMKLNYALLT